MGTVPATAGLAGGSVGLFRHRAVHARGFDKERPVGMGRTISQAASCLLPVPLCIPHFLDEHRHHWHGSGRQPCHSYGALMRALAHISRDVSGHQTGRCGRLWEGRYCAVAWQAHFDDQSLSRQQVHSTWPLLTCMASTWPLLGLYAASTWPLLGLYLASAHLRWPLPGLYLASTHLQWPLRSLYLASTWPLLGLYSPAMALMWPLPGLYLASTWPLLTCDGLYVASTRPLLGLYLASTHLGRPLPGLYLASTWPLL